MGVREVYEYFLFDGRSSRDFEALISGGDTFKAPERDVEIVSIPGRNGAVTFDNGRFNNIHITYPTYINKAFRMNFDALKAFLLSKRGYKRLEDTYHPEYYRMAQFISAIEPSVGTLNRSGKFDIVFDCMPQRFLKSGEKVITLETGRSIKNPTLFDALPLIRAYGRGTLNISGTSATITESAEYTDIDCEMMNAYKGNYNRNNYFSGKFPVLKPGINLISFSGFTKLEITPRWWTI